MEGTGTRTVEPGGGYEFYDFENGFEIRREDRNPVRVILDKENYHWKIRYVRYHTRPSVEDCGLVDGEILRPDYNSGLPVRVNGGTVTEDHCEITNAYTLTRLCSTALSHTWNSPRYKPQENPWYGVRQWVADQCSRSIGRSVAKRWRRILAETYTPEFIAFTRRVFSVTFKHPSREQCRLLFRIIQKDPQMVEDIYKYRAAAHAVMMVRPDVNANSFNSKNWPSVFQELHALELSRSKRRTIMNLPHGVSTSALRSLSDHVIDRPILTRIGLNWAGALARMFAIDPTRFQFFYATDEDIIKACQRLVPHESPRKMKTFLQVAQYISDMFRGMTNGEVYDAREWRTANATVKRAIAWHRQDRERQMLRDVPPDVKETAAPPIPPPEDEHITFLSTPRAIVEESDRMGHCVYLYVGDAVRGRSFLFHTVYRGHMATTQVDRTGRVVQSYGPHNTINSASKYAERALTVWGKQFPETEWQRAQRRHRENNPRVGEFALHIDENGIRAVPYNALPAG